MLKEISLKAQIKSSSLVIEGEVIAKKSVWDNSHKNIYTINTVRVSKVFKGDLLKTVDIVTLGGTVGETALIVSPSLNLSVRDIGVFMLENDNLVLNKTGKSSSEKFKPYGSLQGFYKYNLYDDLVVNPFNKKQGISSSFYAEIMDYTKSNYTEMSSFNVNQFSKSNLSKSLMLPPEAITFSPTTSTGGTKSVLTINGTGFGATKGRVGFSNADDGGATFVFALDTQVLTWSNTRITVEIPSSAGTGNILVENADTTTGQSTSDLTITYSESNAEFDPDGNGPLGLYAYPIRHINSNGSGGYTFQMQTGFFNNSEFQGAKAAFEKVLDQWRCETKVNWIVAGSATGIDIAAADDVSVVKFDNNNVPSDNLPAGVLGQTFSRVSGCGISGMPATWNAHVTEIDIVFDSAIDWFFGTGLPDFVQYDFESVALHELGHAHQLSHVIDDSSQADNSNDVMHYAISNGEQQRVLNSNNITAASNVHGRSITVNACSQGLMIDYVANCTLSTTSDNEGELASDVSIFPNPTKGNFSIKKGALISLEKAAIYDISGRLISEHDISDASNIKTINLFGVSKGVYFVNIHSEGTFITKKLIFE
ncbi:hypothetical protein A8C32_11385 [Flavivirga aquatica]|uniref:Uncharacterized protein n=2 Tax=Flavivirga aquatica TaxID=1849968 RepID=A0A1E5TD90_9FLAO|nr:hypothetical protein A8C32_11385 [Flavivirga aquatica]